MKLVLRSKADVCFCIYCSEMDEIVFGIFAVFWLMMVIRSAFTKFKINASMASIILICLLVVLSSAQHPTLCPQDTGLVISGRLDLSLAASQVPGEIMIPSSQTLTVDYSLSSPFSRVPGVAIST